MEFSLSSEQTCSCYKPMQFLIVNQVRASRGAFLIEIPEEILLVAWYF
jgi:hypothetical protein